MQKFSEIAPNYHAALMALGATNEERARRLGVSDRSIVSYLNGSAFPAAHILKLVPELDAAYTADFRSILPLVKRREGPKSERRAA